MSRNLEDYNTSTTLPSILGNILVGPQRRWRSLGAIMTIPPASVPQHHPHHHHPQQAQPVSSSTRAQSFHLLDDFLRPQQNCSGKQQQQQQRYLSECREVRIIFNANTSRRETNQQCVTRFGAAGGKRPARHCTHARREMVLRAHTIVRVYCVSGNSYLYHHILNQQPPTILIMFHLSSVSFFIPGKRVPYYQNF